jgi:hypothetical protein
MKTLSEIDKAQLADVHEREHEEARTRGVYEEPTAWRWGRHPGVHWDTPTGKWMARTKVGNYTECKLVFLGRFDDEHEAVDAIEAAKMAMYPRRCFSRGQLCKCTCPQDFRSYKAAIN